MRVLVACERYGRIRDAMKDRGIRRSITYQGIANAMAEQWSRR